MVTKLNQNEHKWFSGGKSFKDGTKEIRGKTTIKGVEQLGQKNTYANCFFFCMFFKLVQRLI